MFLKLRLRSLSVGNTTVVTSSSARFSFLRVRHSKFVNQTLCRYLPPQINRMVTEFKMSEEDSVENVE